MCVTKPTRCWCRKPPWVKPARQIRLHCRRRRKAEQKLVSLGPTDGESVSVTGLSETDRVITGNLQKIGPGSPVAPITPKEASLPK